LIPLELNRVLFCHLSESDGMKSITLIGSIFAPRVAAIIAVFAWMTADSDAV
jgi:hypothetical protein